MSARTAESYEISLTWWIDRFAALQGALSQLHAPRERTIDGGSRRWCRECGQNWPCPTVLIVERSGEDPSITQEGQPE